MGEGVASHQFKGRSRGHLHVRSCWLQARSAVNLLPVRQSYSSTRSPTSSAHRLGLPAQSAASVAAAWMAGRRQQPSPAAGNSPAAPQLPPAAAAAACGRPRCGRRRTSGRSCGEGWQEHGKSGRLGTCRHFLGTCTSQWVAGRAACPCSQPAAGAAAAAPSAASTAGSQGDEGAHAALLEVQRPLDRLWPLSAALHHVAPATRAD